jgi:hypothetical protein
MFSPLVDHLPLVHSVVAWSECNLKISKVDNGVCYVPCTYSRRNISSFFNLRLYTDVEKSSLHQTWGWVGPSSGLDASGARKFPHRQRIEPLFPGDAIRASVTLLKAFPALNSTLKSAVVLLRLVVEFNVIWPSNEKLTTYKCDNPRIWKPTFLSPCSLSTLTLIFLSVAGRQSVLDECGKVEWIASFHLPKRISILTLLGISNNR